MVDRWLEKNNKANEDYRKEVKTARMRKRAEAEVLLEKLIRDGLSDDQISRRLRESSY